MPAACGADARQGRDVDALGLELRLLLGLGELALPGRDRLRDAAATGTDQLASGLAVLGRDPMADTTRYPGAGMDGGGG